MEKCLTFIPLRNYIVPFFKLLTFKTLHDQQVFNIEKV